MIFNVAGAQVGYYQDFLSINDIELGALQTAWVLFVCNFGNSQDYELSFVRDNPVQIITQPTTTTIN